MCLVEDRNLQCKVSTISRHVDIYLDREYDVDEDDSERIYEDDRYFIRRVVNLGSHTVRPVQYMHPTRGELEVLEYGREYLEKIVTKPHTFLPYLLFIDDFGVHRNMYRALKAFYIIPVCLSYAERRKVANVFTLTLGPHGAEMKDVVEGFRKPIRKLDRGLNMEVNGSIETVLSFVMTFLGDMPQQADNGGFFRHSAKHGCRTCFCSKEDRGNLEYDTIDNGRTHLHTLFLWEDMKHMNGVQRQMQMRKAGMKSEPPVVMRLAPALDLIQSRAYDAPHSEWRGLGRIFHSFLLSSILSKRGSASYLRSFQTFCFPSGWPRIGSPTLYIWSWSLSEAGRALLLVPLILRSHATIGWFRLSYLQAAEEVLPPNTFGLRAIIKAFGIIARTNTLVGSQRYTLPRSLHHQILEARHAYQDLIQCAIRVGQGFAEEVAEDAAQDEDAAAIVDILSGAVQSESESEEGEVAQPTTTTTSRNKTNKRGKESSSNRFKKLLALPNVHAGLHLAANAEEMATIMNSNVLAGELKHM